MAERTAGGGSSSAVVLASAMAGALLGAGSLAWWLLSQAQQRRLQSRQQRLLQVLRQQGPEGNGLPPESGLRQEERTFQERQLHDRVHQLNQAIEDVRRQLENLQPES